MKRQHSESELLMSKGILESLSSLYPLQDFEIEAINVAINTLDNPQKQNRAEEAFILACNSMMHDREYMVRDFGSKGTKKTCINVLKNIYTCDLVEELTKREGVAVIQAEPYNTRNIEVDGPALVLIITD